MLISKEHTEPTSPRLWGATADLVFLARRTGSGWHMTLARCPWCFLRPSSFKARNLQCGQILQKRDYIERLQSVRQLRGFLLAPAASQQEVGFLGADQVAETVEALAF